MSKIVKLLCLCLIAVFAFSAVGCGGGNDGLQKDEKGVYYLDDDGVKVYKIVMMDHGVPFNTTEFKYRQQVLDEINSRLHRDLGYKIDPTVEVYADDTFSDKLATRLADGDHLDLVRQVSKDNLDSYVDQGIALDISQYFDKADSLKENISATMLKEVTYDGKIHAIPLDNLPVTAVANIRGDLLEKAGYTELNSMEDWEGFLQKVKDGGTEYLNSRLQTIPLMGNLSYLESMFYCNYTSTPGNFLNDQGKLRPKYFNDGYKEFILKMREWLSKGYIDNSIFSFGEFNMGTYMTNQITAVTLSGIYHLEFGSLLSVNTSHPEWKMGMQFPVIGSEGRYVSTGLMGEFVFVPYCAKSAGVVIDLINWSLFNKENYMLLGNGILDLTYTVSEDNVIDVPEAEKTVDITSPADLIGRFSAVTSVEFNMGYPRATCPEGAKAAYAKSLQIEESKLYVDPILYISQYQTDRQKQLIASANSEAERIIQQLLTYKNGVFSVSDADFDKTWNGMVNGYSAVETFDELTELYNSHNG